MDCNEVKNLIIDRLDENLPESILNQIDKHIETCDSCQEELIQTGKLLNLVSATEDEEPAPGIKDNFYSMLNKEAHKIKVTRPDKRTAFLNRHKIITRLKYAASIIILISLGFIAGSQTQKTTNTKNEISLLREEISQLQQHANLVALNQPSASERLKVINTVNREPAINNELLYSLVNTLNNDDNVNVRMAAAYALAKYPENEFVRTSLIQSLDNQTEPIIQISLIGILVDIQDKRAKPAIENMLKKENILPEVKVHASKVLTVFQT